MINKNFLIKLAIVVILPLLIRTLIAPLDISYGVLTPHNTSLTYEYPLYVDTLPRDFTFYSDVGLRVLAGKRIYGDDYSLWKSDYRSFNYTPGFPIVWAFVIYLFGVNFVALKMASVLFDVGCCALVYLIFIRFMEYRSAIYMTILYAFAYMALIDSAVLGGEDSGFMFFSFLAVYLALSSREMMSAVALAFAVYFKTSTAIYAIPLFLYQYYGRGLKSSIRYTMLSVIVFLILLSPFLVSEGLDVFKPFMMRSIGIDGLGVANLVRLSFGLPWHFFHPNVYLRDANPDDPLNEFGRNPVAVFFMASGSYVPYIVLVGMFVYAHKNRMLNKEEELIRNITIFGILETLTLKISYDRYIFWLWPFVLLSLFLNSKKKMRFSYFGFVLIICGVVIQAAYQIDQRWLPMWQIWVLILSDIIIFVGSWKSFAIFDDAYRNILMGIVSVQLYFELVGGNPLRIFKFLFPSVSEDGYRIATYYGSYYIMVIVNISFMLLLLMSVHKAFKKREVCK